jgi:hypothetical protein
LAAFTKLTLGQLSEQFKYTKKDGSIGSISFAAPKLNELIELQEFVRNFKHEADHDWLADTAEDFIWFQDILVDDPKHAKPAVATVSGAASSSNKGYQMKRQYSDYRDTTKRHFVSSWEKELKVTAITHNCKKPLEESYVPTTPAEMEAFSHDQAFMMGVFMQ